MRRVAVLGGGISGLAAAHRLVARAAPGTLEVVVLEAGARFGGWIRTEEFAGRPVDFGPDSLLVRTPWAAELCRELGIEDELVAPGSGGAFLLLGGELKTLPAGILAGLPNGPRPFIESGLLSPRGLARAGLDLVLPSGRAPTGDESIGSLVRRRFGDEVLERIIDPLLGGVHAGRCDDLSLAATAPQIAAAALADRSLLRGLRKTAPPRPEPGAAPKPVFMGPRGGMERIVEALVAALGAGRAGAGAGAEPGPGRRSVELRREAAVERLAVLAGGRVAVHVEGEAAPLEVDGVVLALPADPSSELLAPHAPAGAAMLARLKYASVAQTALAYDPADAPALPPGTGFLAPRGEGTLMTACTLLDQKWPERRTVGVGSAGAGVGTSGAAGGAAGAALREAVVIKCSAGRIDDRRIDTLTDDQLAVALHRELTPLVGLRAGAKPVAHRVFRARDGLPQYAPGHLDRIAALQAELDAALPAVSLAGSAFRGTSVPLCIRQGRDAADAQLARLGLGLGAAAA